MLKARGIQVTAVCHQAHVDLVKALGPNRVIALEQTDFTTEKSNTISSLMPSGKVDFHCANPS
ncbi:hypothetical protein [Algoriphagus boritolerans]|uniref:hypothetical protein n=1 Tax=Algoriphagus boritolerans TaxID=308111 RepID=UPI002FCE007D